MEQYVKEDASLIKPDYTIKQGKYYSRIHEKHIASYGEYGAANIRDNITATFGKSLVQLEDPNQNNNVLLIGKVQSGKTSNLEMFTALAFDNGFNFVVIYGGYDGTLLSQTTDRFKNTFDIPNKPDYSDDYPVIFTSDDSNILTVDDEIIEDLLDNNKPIFIISMKRPVAMKKVNDLLARIDKSKINAFIIDDEGDQASLNTRKNKIDDASATYAQIVSMKNLLEDPLYLSVTATPQALIFLDEYSRLRPDMIRLIEPGKGYCGVDQYHLYDSGKIELIEDEDQQDLSEGILPETLRNAIRHYIIASAIMHKRRIEKSEMIIHTHRNVDDHSRIYKMVDSYILSFKDQIEYEDDTLNIIKSEFESTYRLYFNYEVRMDNDFEELWGIICSKIIKRIYIILKNSAGQVTQTNEGLRKHKIYIGGDLLQRGVTFDNLVTTYFCRWAKEGGNMDTNLQRARWLGYREKWIDLCKIFTSESIAREFTNLSEIESDLWEQFYSIQKGEMRIEDILIRADNTKQKPTRKGVAAYSSVAFRNKWIKQRVGIFDQNLLKTNNMLVEKIISAYELKDTSAGRRDGGKTAEYALINREDLSELIEHMEEVFDLEPFERKPLLDLITSSGNIPVVLMRDNDGKGRKRAFYPNNKIYALHQGADNREYEKANYLGDTEVIIDKERINIQIHKVVPKKKDSMGKETVLDKEEMKIVSVGRLSITQKRQDVLLKALSELRKNNISFIAYIYGAGEDEDKVKKMVRDYSLEKNVLLMGQQDNVLLKIFDSNCFVLTSDFEGIPNALMEAMSIGIPCISTDCSPGGARLLITDGENGFIVDRGDYLKIAERIMWIGSHKRESEIIGNNATAITKKFSEEKIMDLWENGIKHVGENKNV